MSDPKEGIICSDCTPTPGLGKVFLSVLFVGCFFIILLGLSGGTMSLVSIISGVHLHVNIHTLGADAGLLLQYLSTPPPPELRAEKLLSSSKEGIRIISHNWFHYNKGTVTRHGLINCQVSYADSQCSGDSKEEGRSCQGKDL